MVEDNQIEATESPFAMRRGEIKVFDGKDKYVSMNQIINKINLGHITDLHFEILEIINEFEFITSRQLCQLLEYKNIEYKSQDKLNNKLDSLVKSKILTRYYFDSDEGKGIYRIYCLEKMGKYLLTSREKECKWQPTDNTKPIAMIKKRLAANQVMIAYMRKTKAFDEYEVKPTLNAKTLGKMFKPTGGTVKLTKSGKSINFIFEVVRRESEWEKKLKDKMNFYNDFYKNFIPGDSGFNLMPQLIIVAEDKNHMTEIYKEILKNKLEIEEIKLYFTTDLMQNEETLSDSLIQFSFDEKTKKYKADRIHLKLLE